MVRSSDRKDDRRLATSLLGARAGFQYQQARLHIRTTVYTESHSLKGARVRSLLVRTQEIRKIFCAGQKSDNLLDLRRKQLRTWQQYHSYKGLFRSHSTVKTRILIVQTCTISVQLWLAESCRPTQRRKLISLTHAGWERRCENMVFP